MDTAIALVKEKAKIPASEAVTQLEVSVDTPSPLSLVTGGSSLSTKEVVGLVLTDPGFLFTTFGITVLPLALQVCLPDLLFARRALCSITAQSPPHAKSGSCSGTQILCCASAVQPVCGMFATGVHEPVHFATLSVSDILALYSGRRRRLSAR